MSSINGSQKYEIARAVVDLYEAHEFLNEIAELTYLEMFIKIWQRDRAFIEQFASIGEPPQNTLDLWFDFYVWTISWLACKYYYIWDEAIDSWFRSDIRKKLRDRAKFKSTVRANIEQIISDSHF